MRDAGIPRWAMGIAALAMGALSTACGDDDEPVVTFDAGRRDMAMPMPPVPPMPPPDRDGAPLPPPPPPIDGGGADLGGGDDDCGGCFPTHICCAAPLPCAGMCVPDCRLEDGRCPSPDLTCSETSGICEPGGGPSIDGGMPPMPDASMPPMPDASAPPAPDASMPMTDASMPPRPDGGMGPRDGGMGPRDGGGMMSMDSGAATDAGPTADAGGTACVGTPPTGGGVAEARIGSTTWSAQFSGNFTSISGTTAAIGDEGIWGGEAGYARIFVWSTCSDSWELQQMVTGSTTTDDDVFGAAVSLDGDALAVGAPMRPVGTDTGTAYVFRRSGTTWSQEAAITPPGAAGGRFGRAVAISGTTLAVGAPLGKDPTSAVTYSGIVTIHTRGPGGMWSFRTRPIPAALEHDDAFGYSLDLQGDTLVAGAPGSHVWGASTGVPGKAWVFTGAADTWTESAYLTPSDGANDDWFGKSVARFGDVIVVGAPNHDATSGTGAIANAGAAYVFTRSGGVWTETAILRASDPSADAWFGFSVAAASATRIVVGAAGADRLYSFTFAGGAWTEDAASYTACGAHAGYTLDASGSLVISARPGGNVFDLDDPDDACVM